MAEIKETKRIVVELSEYECALIENALRAAKRNVKQLMENEIYSIMINDERYDRLYQYTDDFHDLAIAFKAYRSTAMDYDLDR